MFQQESQRALNGVQSDEVVIVQDQHDLVIDRSTRQLIDPDTCEAFGVGGTSARNSGSSRDASLGSEQASARAI